MSAKILMYGLLALGIPFVRSLTDALVLLVAWLVLWFIVDLIAKKSLDKQRAG